MFAFNNLLAIPRAERRKVVLTFWMGFELYLLLGNLGYCQSSQSANKEAVNRVNTTALSCGLSILRQFGDSAIGSDRNDRCQLEISFLKPASRHFSRRPKTAG